MLKRLLGACPLAKQKNVLTGTGIYQCACAQVERCGGWHGSRKETWARRGCVRPVPPHADRMACPCELKPAPMMPVPLGKLNHPLLLLLCPKGHLPLEFPHPAPGLLRKRKQGTGDTPGSGEVREGSSCPGSSPASGNAPELRAGTLPALLAPEPRGARALLRADVPPKRPSPLLLPSRCSPFSSPLNLSKTQQKMPFVSDTQGFQRQGDGFREWRDHFCPQLWALHCPGNNAHLRKAKQDFSARALPARPQLGGGRG